MKTYFTKIITATFVIFMMMEATANAQTIVSAQDGDWNTETTWIDGIVPTTTDSVVVQHLVDIYTGDSCRHLYVALAGTIQNRINSSRVLVVLGNLYVDGTLTRSNNYFDIQLGGDLYFNGIWENPRLYFTGNTEQLVSASPGKIFEATQSSIVFEDMDPSSPLKFTTDLTFIDIELIGNGSTVEFSPGIEVAFYGEPIRNANIIGNNSALLMRDGAFVEDSNLDNLTLKGVFNMGEDNTASGEIINADTLQNLINGSRALEVFGNFTNQGFITETNNHFNLIFHGNITNSGIWESSNIYLDGIVDQYLTSEPGSYFLCERIEDREISSKIILVGDLDIRDADIDLNGATMEASGQKITLRMGAYLMDATIDQAVLGGEFKCYNNCIFTGETTISDTLCNYTISTYINLSFHGKLINNGIIRRSNSYAVNLGLLADFENNGPVDIETMTLGGDADQTISSSSKGSVIDVDQVNDTVASSALIITTDLTFIGSAINMGGAEIHQNNGNLIMVGGKLENGTVYSNNNFIRQSDEAFFINMHLNNTHLKGVCQVYSYDNHFTDVSLDDTLQNRSTANYPEIGVHGDFVNNGVINNSNAYRVRMLVDGNFYNHGITMMNQLTFTGTGIQEFSSEDGVLLDTDIISTKPSGYILAVDDLVFEDCIINMDSTTVNLQDADIIMFGGELEETVVDGNNNIMLMHRAKAQNVTLKNLSMEGTTLIHGYHNIMENVTVSDTLSKLSSPARNTYIACKGTFRNNGCITKEGNYNIFFRVEDELINNGIWYSEELSFTGTDLHFIASENGSIFEIDRIVHDENAGAVEIISELYLLNAAMDLNNYSLVIPENGIINLDNSSMNEVNLTCGTNALIHGENNSWIGYSTIDGVSFTGEVEVNKDNTFSNCMLDGDILNPDINRTIYLAFENEFLNNGNIYNNPATNYDLYVNFMGNLHQNGTIQNQEVRWQGTLDQDVYLWNGNDINTLCVFHAMIGTSAYQWYKNDEEIVGETTSTLDFTSITPADRGYYHCETGEGLSRTIRICTPLNIDLATEAWFCQYESVMLEPEVSAGAGPYTYSWYPTEGLSDPNIQNPLANPNESTVYTVTITDAIGCVGESNIFVQQHPQLFATAGSDKEICFGSSTVLPGSASGGTPGYSYAWLPTTGLDNPNVANPLASPWITTSYTLTVTDANGCEESASVNVTVNSLPVAFGLSQDSTHFCYEQDTIICWLLGSEPGVNYELLVNGMPNPGGEVFEGSGAAIPIWASTTLQGHYTLKAVNASTACEQMMLGSVMIFIDFLPEIVDQSNDEIVIEGESTTLWVEVTSTQPPWLQWYKDGEVIPGAQDYNLHLDNVNLDATGIYQCLVTNNCDIAWSDPVSVTVLQRQIIEIPAGWSGFSTYQDVFDADVNNMFDQLSGNLIIVNDFENVFWPGAALNTYGNWNTAFGAQIKLTESASLNVDGFATDDRTLNLEAGWHYLPVLGNCNFEASAIFDQAGANLDLAKDIAGTRVYWPAFGIQTLNILEPGMAYLIKLNSASTITFPDCLKGSPIAPSSKRTVNSSPWPDPTYTGTSHLIVIPELVCNSILQAGDWIGVFDQNGVCAGLAEFSEDNVLITAFADDPTTFKFDGLVGNQPLTLRAYRENTGQYLDLIPNFNTDYHDGYFLANGVSVVEHLKVVDIQPSSGSSNIIIFPNPAYEVINIRGLQSSVSYELINSGGEIVMSGFTDKNGQILRDNLSHGLYTLKLVLNREVVCRKVMIH